MDIVITTHLSWCLNSMPSRACTDQCARHHWKDRIDLWARCEQQEHQHRRIRCVSSEVWCFKCIIMHHSVGAYIYTASSNCNVIVIVLDDEATAHVPCSTPHNSNACPLNMICISLARSSLIRLVEQSIRGRCGLRGGGKSAFETAARHARAPLLEI